MFFRRDPLTPAGAGIQRRQSGWRRLNAAVKFANVVKTIGSRIGNMSEAHELRAQCLIAHSQENKHAIRSCAVDADCSHAVGPLRPFARCKEDSS
jgi:hypothetical protein